MQWQDVSTAGDCALLSLMGNPNFQAPLSTANELRRAVVTFARGVKQQDCITVYSMVGNRSNMSFEVYLENVMRAGFWVGTIFFIWTSMPIFLMSLGNQNARALQSSFLSTFQKIFPMIWINNLWWMSFSTNTAAWLGANLACLTILQLWFPLIISQVMNPFWMSSWIK